MPLDHFTLRACYADTDAAGVIHHARYLEYFERSRTEWLTRIGAGPDVLEAQLNHVLVIREVLLNFHRPGALNDLLVFTHQVTHKGRSQLTLVQRAYRASKPELATNVSEENLLVSATLQMVCVDRATMKSTPLPDLFTVSEASQTGQS